MRTQFEVLMEQAKGVVSTYYEGVFIPDDRRARLESSIYNALVIARQKAYQDGYDSAMNDVHNPRM